MEAGRHVWQLGSVHAERAATHSSHGQQHGHEYTTVGGAAVEEEAGMAAAALGGSLEAAVDAAVDGGVPASDAWDVTSAAGCVEVVAAAGEVV